MSVHRTATLANDPTASGAIWQRPRARPRAWLVLAVASLLLVGALAGARTKPVRADDEPRSGQDVQAQAATGHIRRILKRQHDQMVELAGQVLGRADSTDQLRDQVVNQSITIKSAEAVYQNAHLTREIAEIAVTEYQEGIFVQVRRRPKARSSWPRAT
jgi:hypothetical protein